MRTRAPDAFKSSVATFYCMCCFGTVVLSCLCCAYARKLLVEQKNVADQCGRHARAFDRQFCFFVPRPFSSLWDCDMFLVAGAPKPHSKCCAAVQAAADREPFRSLGCAPENGRALVVQSGARASLTASQLRKADFFRCGSMATRMLQFVEGGGSIRNVHACGRPRRTAYGCTSHARLRNVFLTCMKRPRESKPSCDLWIAAGRFSDPWDVQLGRGAGVCDKTRKVSLACMNSTSTPVHDTDTVWHACFFTFIDMRVIPNNNQLVVERWRPDSCVRMCEVRGREVWTPSVC